MATPSGPRPSVGPAAMPMVPRPSVGPTTTPIKTPRPSVGFSPQPPTSGRSSGRAGTFRRTLARSPTASRSSLASSPGGAPGDGAEADGEPAAAASYAVEGSLDERLGESSRLEGFTTMRAVARTASVMLSRARDARLRLRQRLLDLAHLAPSLLEGLPKSSQKRIAAHVRCRTLYRGDLIFEEGDPPTGYFFIAAGSVSIYKRQSAYVDDDVLEEQDEGPEQVWYGSEPATSALGELIVTLDAGQGFGNFAFSRSGKELRRTASVIYVMDISKNADGALQRKITLLESCFLFDSWTIEATYALAREMVIHAYGEEELIFREGDAVSTMLVVCTGELRVHVAYELDELTTLPLDMALAVNRETWETMRMRCASKYREAPPLVLTIAVTASARYLAEPPSLLGKAEARRYDMPFGRIMELRRVASSIREARATGSSAGSTSRGALERADVTTNGAIDMATKLRNDFGQSPKEPWDPTKGALEVHRDDESTSAALGRAAVDVDAMPTVLVCAASARLRHFLAQTFEKLGCVVDAEARGSRARERMRLSTARPYALAVFASRLNAGLGGMRCAEAHRQWEMDHGIAPGHRAHQNLALLPDKEPSDELRARARGWRCSTRRPRDLADLLVRNSISDVRARQMDFALAMSRKMRPELRPAEAPRCRAQARNPLATPSAARASASAASDIRTHSRDRAA
ncbi:hypothetical protein JL720_3163 [Aureococcus anophagefferens]|nr:hypothetical protein JL720_3163 [Aureococcus anophagefferens]